MIAFILRTIEGRRLFKVALSYNKRYTFSMCERHGHSWMCPGCGRIHRAHSVAKFSGPQFDACCHLPAGGRQERRFAMP